MFARACRLTHFDVFLFPNGILVSKMSDPAIRPIAHNEFYDRKKTDLAKNRSKKTDRAIVLYCRKVAAAILLLSSFIQFYGCSAKKENDFSSNTQKTAAIDVKLAKTDDFSDKTAESDADSPDNSPHSPPIQLPTDVLSGATDRFVESFTDETIDSTLEQTPEQAQNEGGSVNKANKKDKANSDDLDVPDEVRKKYQRLPDILFAPKIDSGNVAADAPRYTLRYKFEPASEMTWNVSHRLWKETVYGGMTRKIETVSTIVRRWKFGPMDQAAESLPVEYQIDRMRLEQFEQGAEAVSYDSQTDMAIPEEFRRFGTEKMIGVVLERFRLDRLGLMTDKTITVDGFQSDAQDSRLTIPFPADPVAVGESWTVPCTFYLKAKDLSVVTVKGIERFRLENVTGTLATIRLSMTALSLVNDPYLEGQLAEKLCEGVCRFDIESGRTLKTQLEFSRTVPNAFGEATMLVYRCQITEEPIP